MCHGRTRCERVRERPGAEATIDAQALRRAPVAEARRVAEGPGRRAFPVRSVAPAAGARTRPRHPIRVDGNAFGASRGAYESTSPAAPVTIFGTSATKPVTGADAPRQTASNGLPRAEVPPWAAGCMRAFHHIVLERMSTGRYGGRGEVCFRSIRYTILFEYWTMKRQRRREYDPFTRRASGSAPGSRHRSGVTAARPFRTRGGLNQRRTPEPFGGPSPPVPSSSFQG